MHRSASPRTRPPNAVTHILRRPLGKVIELAPYLHRVKAPLPEPPIVEEPVTDVREITPLASDVVNRSVKLRHRKPGLDRLRGLLHERHTSRELRLMNQFVRCVFSADGIESYVYRWGRNVEEWRDALFQTECRMRRFVERAEDTGACTRRGYMILHAKNPRGRHVFITRDERDDRIVAFYKGAQWNHKRANRRDRAESHHLALVHRRNKARLSPR